MLLCTIGGCYCLVTGDRAATLRSCLRSLFFFPAGLLLEIVDLWLCTRSKLALSGYISYCEVLCGAEKTAFKH